MASEAYDDQNNLWKYRQAVNQCYPNLPGTRLIGLNITNFIAANYLFETLFFNAPRPLGGFVPNFGADPNSRFERNFEKSARSGPEVFLLLFLQKKKILSVDCKKDVDAGLRQHDGWGMGSG